MNGLWLERVKHSDTYRKITFIMATGVWSKREFTNKYKDRHEGKRIKEDNKDQLSYLPLPVNLISLWVFYVFLLGRSTS
jgi:hypothetical protein